jgi:hypothetical protein
MTNPPEQPSGANEFAPLENTPKQYDPYAPVDYPATNPGQPETVIAPAYPTPPAYPAAPGYGPPAGYSPASGYPAPPGYPATAGYPPPVGYPQGPGGYPGAPGFPHGLDPYDPYRAMHPVGSNGKAIASLVTSLAGLFFCGLPSIVGLILGIIAMRETKQTGQDGYGLALAGVIVGGLVTAGWVLYLILIFGLAVSGWSAV